jgi:hypothetical protein
MGWSMSGESSGDVFTNISNATIVNRSTLTGSLNAASNAGHQDAREMLERIASLVESSNNPEVADLFNSFTEELAQEQPKKPVLKATLR